MHQLPKSNHRAFLEFPAKSSNSAKSITLASICLLLAFLACTPATPTVDTSLQQTQVAESVEATLRAQVQTPTTTVTPLIMHTPTNTPTPTPTESPWIEGSVERAPYDPAAGWGTPDAHDDFSGTNPEFELDNAGGVAHGWYQNGRFNITFPTRGWWTWYSGSTSLMNFYIDVVVYNGDQCVDRDAGGLLYRYLQAMDYGMLFGVTCGGGYFSGITGGLGATGPVCRFINSAPVDPGDLDCSGLWNHPTSIYIDAGPGAANRIGIRALGQQITLFINGHLVETLILPGGLVYSGNFALYLGAGQADHASVSFDNLSIWFNP